MEPAVGSSKLAYSLIFLALLFGGTYYLVKNNEAKGHPTDTTRLEYANTIFGFSITYDRSLSLVEFTPAYITIEDPSRAEPNELVQITVETASASDVPETFEVYVHAKAQNYCAADGPGGSLHCDSVTRSEPFMTATGISGEVFYLALTHEIFAAEGIEAGVTTREAGPFFAFNISANSPATAFAALIVRPADFFSESERFDAGARAALDVVNTLFLHAR